MNRVWLRVLTGTAVLLGVAHVLELLFFTQGTAGFVTVGSVWLRYGLLFGYLGVVAVGARLSGPRGVQRQYALPPAGLLLVLAALSAAAGIAGVGNAVGKLLSGSGIFGGLEYSMGMRLLAFLLRFLSGASLMTFGGWCFVLARRGQPLQKEEGTVRSAGFAAVFGFFLLPLLRYADNPATIYRVTRILPIFSALGALYFAVKLLGILCAEPTAEFARSLCASGLSVFFLGTCLEFPQTLWSFFYGDASVPQLALSAALGALGVLGLWMARRGVLCGEAAD